MVEAVQAKFIFAQNMRYIVGNRSLKDLVREANEVGITMNYPYVNTVRKGTINVSTDKCDDIVSMLKLLPGFESIELWMMFFPGYFKEVEQPKVEAPNQAQAQSGHLDLKKLLTVANSLKLIAVDEEQIQHLLVLSKYGYGK